VILNAANTSDCRLLKRDRQQSTEDPFHCRSAVVVCLEFFCSVRDMIPRIVGNSPEIVASFLFCKLRMVDGAHKFGRSAAIEERTAVLNICNSLSGHFSFAVHLQVAGAENLVAVPPEAVLIGNMGRIDCDVGFCLKSIPDVPQDVF